MPYYNIQSLLSNATNNINQIAKRVNTTGVIYAKDIEDIRKQIIDISKHVVKILSYLQSIGKEKKLRQESER